MPTAAFTTLGCKVNQYETQRILESFSEAGFQVVTFDSAADVYVINSCSVTSIAESKSRYTIRKAARSNPAAKILVTGCAAQMALNKGEAIEGADVLVPNPQKLESLSYLFDSFPELADRVRSEPFVAENAPMGRTRATLKIQDGCSVMCSYCSIPYTRPGLVSRSASEVLAEARKMVEMGYREIVLTGVLIGAYGSETGSGGPNFEDLIELLHGAYPETRLRISSIEMRQVTPRLVSLLQDGFAVPHLHIPLQSGSTDVLRAMNRPYSQDDYLMLCERLYRAVPDISITTDIMVGFPTESELDFLESVKVCEEVGYLKAHVFRFSPRFGTPADAWGDPVAGEEKQRRATILGTISSQTGAAHSRRFLGRTMRVLVEGKPTKNGLMQGMTDNYLEVEFAGPVSLSRHFAWVRLMELRDGGLVGELAAEPASRTVLELRQIASMESK